MAGNKDKLGVTVNLYLDGSGYGSTDITLSCELNSDDQYKCPFMMTDIMPPKPGSKCAFKEGYTCLKAVASLDALKRAEACLKAEIKRINAEIEE